VSTKTYPTGLVISGWTPSKRPERTVLSGQHCSLHPLEADRHGPQLSSGYRQDGDWTYLPYGPFPDRIAFVSWLRTGCAADDPLFFAVLVDGTPLGMTSLLNIRTEHGVVEVGHVHYGEQLQRTPAATEAVTLLASYVFNELGYRRLEWKCDALNERSKRAAVRLGFRPEGVFRQDRIVKGRNRDTAWFSIVDVEWPRLERAHQAWLAPGNFDAGGRQRERLTDILARSE